MNEVVSSQDPISPQHQLPQYLPSSTSAADFQEVELSENAAYGNVSNVTVVESLADQNRSFDDAPAAGVPHDEQAIGQTNGSHAITVSSHHHSHGHHNAFRNPPIVLQWKDVVYSIKGSWSIRGRSKDKIILNKVSGYVMPGEVLAILGPSGAGKTSLLNILSHRVKERSYKGSVTANGNKIPKRYHALAAFVQQDDILNGNLSVKETLIYTALLKLPKSMTYKQKIAQVNEIIEELGLQKCKDTKVGIPGVFKGISGGERKRLSIGIELITNPSILFLDEPTTGLDAKTALNIMHAIRRIAKNGRTVVLTIHQPRSDIFHLFDKLLLLARGKTAYFGKASEATQYFEKMGYFCPSEYNPADFIIDLVAETPLDLMGPNTSTPPTSINPTPPLPPKATIQSETELSLTHKYYENLQHQTQQDQVNNKEAQEKEAVKVNSAPRPLNEDDLRVEKILAYYEQNHLSADVAPPVETANTENLNKGSSYASSWITQFLVILVRSFISYIRDRSLMLTRLAQNLVMSILIGIIFLRLGYTQTNIQDRSGVLFFILINQTMNNLFAAMMAFPAEAAVFSRERSSKTYRISSYYLGKVLAEIPNLMVFPILFGTIVYWMVGLNPGADRFFIFLLILVSITFAAQSLGYLISAVAPKPELALTIAPVVTTVLMLFGGFYLNVENIPVYFIWVYWISFFHYAYEALILNEWRGVTLTCLPDQLKFNVCPVTSGQQVIDNLKMNGKMSNLWFDIGMILAFALVCKILSFFALRFLRKPKIK